MLIVFEMAGLAVQFAMSTKEIELFSSMKYMWEILELSAFYNVHLLIKISNKFMSN